jgi:hypothetical protein
VGVASSRKYMQRRVPKKTLVHRTSRILVWERAIVSLTNHNIITQWILNKTIGKRTILFCYFCHSNDNCEVDTQIHYTLCSSCRTSDATLGWWDNTDDVGMDTYDLNMNMDTLSDPLVGLGLQYTYVGDPKEDVSLILMQKGSRMKPAKRGAQKVSVDHHRGHFKYESKLVRNIVDRQRKQEDRKRNRQESLQKAANTIPMKKISMMFGQQHAVSTLTLYPSVFHLLEPLFPVGEASIDSILDEALADYGTDLIARDHDKDKNSGE